jgi:hypothetical protein
MKCPKCGYDNAEDAVSCNLCSEVLRKEKGGVTIERGEARFGRHAPLPEPLAAKLSELAASKAGLSAVYLFTMSMNGSPPLSAFGFGADGPAGMRDAQLFLREADPHMPQELISKDLQCMPMSPEMRAGLKAVAILLLDR